MKILHVISTFPPAYAFGGPPKVAFDVCKELAKRGHYVEVYTTNAYDQKRNFKPLDKQIVIRNIKVTYFSNFPKIKNLYVAPEMIVKLWKILEDFDIVHVHFGRQLYDAFFGLGGKKICTPYVLQAHGALPHIGRMRRTKIVYDKLFGWRTIRNASKVIALNCVEAEQYKAIGVPEEKIAIIPNGIDFSEYADLPPKGSFKRKFNIPEDRKIILYLGRIHKIKGIDVLVKAYAHLKNEMNVNDAVLVVAGPDDGFLNEVKSLTYNLGIADSVLFTGPLYGRDKLEAFVDSEIYVLPSRYETFPMTILEAYACGKPIIASKIDGLKDLVIDGETGLLFEPENVKQLVEKMIYLLNNDEKAMEIARKARILVKEKYTIDKVIDVLEKLYIEVACKGCCCNVKPFISMLCKGSISMY
jgi:glycosyltransferase involved in cell wall biosynthesis